MRRRRTRTPPRPENRPLIRVFQAMNVCYARVYHRLTVQTPCPIPRDGAGILISNHTSALDPLLIQSVCSRLIVWMVASEYMQLPALRWLFARIEAIPVARSGRDVAATRAAMRALEAGRIVGVFPEGRIEKTRELLRFQTGAAMLALRTGVPVYPAYLDGTQRRQSMGGVFLHRQNAELTFGKAIRLKKIFSADDLNGATLALQASVRLLGKEPHRDGLEAQKAQKTEKIPRRD